MAEVEPEMARSYDKALDIPCVNVLGLPETDSPMTIRELTARIAAADPETRRTWAAYMPPTKPADAMKLEDLIDLDEVDELDEMSEDDKEDLAASVLASLEHEAFRALNEQVDRAGKKRKHPISATSWFTLNAEELRWTAELKEAVRETTSPPEVQAFTTTMSDFEFAQFAIVAKGDVLTAIERMANVAKLKLTYRPENAVRQDPPSTTTLRLGFILCQVPAKPWTESFPLDLLIDGLR